ncbi:hypothetical protein [Streptomyces sp. TP-A0874]|uniref:hypothetical protein n=1 Tax=Streptomyces sp. TP-A0874 TaxID=549819 RepID=UPI00147D285D|nr:hypothetical protein [Streptomyces sp. TP-A0874]
MAVRAVHGVVQPERDVRGVKPRGPSVPAQAGTEPAGGDAGCLRGVAAAFRKDSPR